MRNIYKSNPMNAPRLNTDRHFADYSNTYSYIGAVDKAFRFIESFQLLDADMWKRFVNQFREEDADYEGGWRGEYWGKCMRGAAFVYSYTKNPELYRILENTVRDMIASGRSDEGGRISCYARSHEFCHWDIWERKYVLLGMQYFYEIAKNDDIRAEIIKSMRIQADCIIESIGPECEGKKPISRASHHWRGLNSSSLLEPIVRLYTLTGEQKYFDFAKYIVDEGGTDIVNIFDLAYDNDFKPYQYPVTKAYEMTSCFEGLLEFYRITKNERYLTAIVNYANSILETDFTVIGCAGCTHELFDHSTVRQANTNNDPVMQETCVTVTLMKFFYQLNLITGDAKYMDAYETAFYNAYLGSLNTEKIIDPSIVREHPDWVLEPLPFDSYSPLVAGLRGTKVGGLKVMSDKHYYGCCACIGAAGIGLFAKAHVEATECGIVMNLYTAGKVTTYLADGTPITLTTDSDYPKSGRIKITVNLPTKKAFELKLRIPEWSRITALNVCGDEWEVKGGYTSVSKEFRDGDEITLDLDMRCRAMLPIPYGSQILMNKVLWGVNMMISTFDKEDPLAHKHVAFRRGPVMLAEENRLGYSVDDPIEPSIRPDGYVDLELTDGAAPYEAILEAYLPLENGEKMLLTDYASAGKLWSEESKMAVWMLTK